MGLGYFVGPFLGALVILAVGTRGGFAVQSVGVVLAGYLMARMDDPPRPPDAEPGGVPLRQNLRRHRVLLATLGTGALLMGAARASCDAVLPPWADHLGLHAATASLVFGIGAAVMHRFISRYSPRARGACAESDENAAQKGL
ncbi:MFS transporter [Mycolicibacterium smegmatis]|uniref:MFS transporter n=1 Tax=Mycolicibacterium smegmatis TaxID=1772 RepID=UPI0020A5255F|nr:MFS transporter [Mycolicibacterium smegmatis]